MCVRWVPRLLTENHKLRHLESFQKFTARFAEEDEVFWSWIVTCPRLHSWIQQASKEWQRKGEAAPVKAKAQLSAGKILSTVVFDRRGILLIDFLHEWYTIKAAYYCELLKKVRDAHCRKRRDQPIREVILLHDNGRPHTAALTVAKLQEMYWAQLDHSPYSQDLSPCDFYLFGPLKEGLGRLEDDGDVKGFMLNWFQM